MSAHEILPGGVLVALVSPLDDAGELDLSGLERLLERVLNGGVLGISPTGSTGEGARLPRRLRHRIVDAVRTRIPDAMPIVAGLPVTAVDEAAQELRALADRGASAALVAPPSYYPSDAGAVERLYTQLADASPIPLVLYNIPVFTKVRLDPGVVATLAGHPQIVGIKDSSRDIEYLQQLRYAVDDSDTAAGADFRILTGSDTLLLASLLLGAHGTIAASANLVPELVVELYDAVGRADFVTARMLQRQLFQVGLACRRGAAPAGWKAALEIAGVCSARLAPPAGRLPETATRELAVDLRRLLPERPDRS